MFHKLMLEILAVTALIGLTGSLAAMETMDSIELHDDISDHERSALSGPLASGRVVAVDHAGGNITLDYLPIPLLLLEGGVRHFPVKDAGALTGLSAGDKVRFEIERDGRQFIIKHVVNTN